MLRDWPCHPKLLGQKEKSRLESFQLYSPLQLAEITALRIKEIFELCSLYTLFKTAV